MSESIVNSAIALLPQWSEQSIYAEHEACYLISKYLISCAVHVLMRDEKDRRKEERGKQGSTC